MCDSDGRSNNLARGRRSAILTIFASGVRLGITMSSPFRRGEGSRVVRARP